MKKALILCFILGLNANFALASAFGGYDPGAVNAQNVRDLQLHENITRAKAKNDMIIKAKNTQEAPKQVVDADIQNITFVGNSLISSADLLNVVKNKLNSPMNIENLSAIRKAVARYYQQRGFFSVIVVISQQDFKTGSVVIDIKEGTRNSITVE